jgi:hypothetical protein
MSVRTFKDVLDDVTAKQHELRVVEFLAEQLRPFTDMDVGRRKQLEAEGCLVPFVPVAVIMNSIRNLAKEMQAIEAQIDKLQAFAANPVAAPRRKKAELPAPTPVLEPAKRTRKKAAT